MGEDDMTDSRCPWSVQPTAVSSLCPRALPTGWPPGDFRATQPPPTPLPGMASTFNNSWGSLGLFSPTSWQVKGQAVGRGLRSLSAASGALTPSSPTQLPISGRQPASPLFPFPSANLHPPSPTVLLSRSASRGAQNFCFYFIARGLVLITFLKRFKANRTIGKIPEPSCCL